MPFSCEERICCQPWRSSDSTSMFSTSRIPSLREIQKHAFHACTALKSVYLPDSVYTIGPYAFAGCSNLHTVRLGNAVMKIDDNTFTRGQDDIPFEEFSFSTPSTLSAVFEHEFEGTATASKEAMRVTKEAPSQIEKEKGTVACIQFDQSPLDIIRRIRLYQFVCDFNRGGGPFLQRQQQPQKQAGTSEQIMEYKNRTHDGGDATITSDGDDDGDNCAYQRSYPPALWPLILSRLFMHLTPFAYGFFANAFHGRKDVKDLCNDNDNKEDSERRCVTVVYHLLLQGVVTDLCAYRMEKKYQNDF